MQMAGPMNTTVLKLPRDRALHSVIEVTYISIELQGGFQATDVEFKPIDHCSKADTHEVIVVPFQVDKKSW